MFGKKDSRVIVQEDEATKRAKLIAEAMTNIDLLEKYASAFISVNIEFWHRIKNDANIPDDLKYDVWKHSTSEFWETVRSGGIFTMTETVKHVGRIIRDAIMKALEEAD